MKAFSCITAVIGLAATMANATVVTIQDTTASGNGTNVRDSYLRQDGGLADTNGGATSGDVRMYPDTGFPDGKGQRHNLVWFDLSGIPSGSTINSATYSFKFNRSSSAAPAITGYDLSQLNSGKDWIEGVGTSVATANAGEPTFNSQKHNLNPAWASPGATGAADIDIPNSIVWNKTAGNSETISLTVTTFVNNWVNGGLPNNGMLMWGGTGPGGSANNYWLIVTSEDPSMADRPRLTVDYSPAPEPASALLLLGGLAFARRRKVSA